MEEIWKDIQGYEGLYQVSNLGRIKSSNGIRKIYVNKKDGYCYITLSKNGTIKNYKVHRLIANTFIPNPKNYSVINHKDGNKHNNRIDNLEFCTQKDNVIHAIKKLKVDYSKGIEKTHKKNEVKVIRSDGKIYNSIKEAKKDLNNKYAHIVEVCQKKLKTTCGYGWEYYKED